MAEAGTYVIQVQSSPTWCMGVQGESAENSPVVLMPLNSNNTQWILDPASQLITLAANTSVVLTIQAVTPGDQVTLCVAPVAQEPLNQQWDWWSMPPLITLASAPTFCVDNRDGILIEGNTIQIYSIVPNDPFQTWSFLRVQ